MFKTGTIIVLFNNQSIENLINAIAKTSDVIVLVDNSEDSRIVERNKKINNKKVKYIGHGKNEGIAKAQNRGLIYLKQYNMDFIFFFDQDSKVTGTFQREMINEFNRISKHEHNLAILAPSIYELNKKRKNQKSYELMNEVISSGSLIIKNLVNKIGMMEEQLFIDYVDFEFCWRAYSRGFVVARTNKIYMHHSVGKKVYKFLGKHIYIPAPFRYFYQYRNGLWLLRRDYVPKQWKKREKKIRILNIVFSIFLFDSKKERLKNICKGIKSGRYNEDISSNSHV